MTFPGGQYQLRYGNSVIDYELTYSSRKTLGIRVYPDKTVVVDAPVGSQIVEIEQKVHKRAGWILRQQRLFQTYPSPKSLPNRYVSGESYRYLGRQYRLKIIEDIVQRVILSGGYLKVYTPNTADKLQIARLLEQWYQHRARRIFAERLALCFPRVEALGVHFPELTIRKMKLRWGSCSSSGRISLNPILIQMPKPLIDYVILHELCHLKQPSHSAAFYALLERVLPDWRDRREKLNQVEVL